MVLIVSCSNSNSNQSEDDKKNNENTASEEKPEIRFELLDFNKATLDEDEKSLINNKIKGELVEGKKWNDKNGANITLFTVIEKFFDDPMPGHTNKEVHAYHFAKADDNYKLIREVQDFENDCIFDNRLKLINQSITVSDIDKDNYGEITFMYRLGCTSEFSPDGLKLMMLENGDKYAIRGNTKISSQGPDFPDMGGKTTVDPSFDNAPEGFKDHALKIWKLYQKH